MSLTVFMRPRSDARITEALLKSMKMTVPEALEKGLLQEKGLYFMKTGAEIAEGCLKRVAELKKKLSAVTGAARSKPQFGENLGSAVILPEDEQPESASVGDFVTRETERMICQLETIARNVDKKKKYCLYEWDLERYGL